MIHPKVLAYIANYLAERIRPKALPPTVLEFSATLKFRDRNKVKPYQPALHPPQWFFLHAFGEAVAGRTQHRRFLQLKPTQDGGTMTGQVIPQLYVTVIDQHPVLAGFPDMQLAGKQWRQKLRPLIVDSKMTDILPTTGPGSEGNSSPIEVALKGTSLNYMGAGAKNEAAQAMLTGKLLTRDEYDSIDQHNATLMEGRLDDYGPDGIIIDTTTLKLDVASPIVDAIASDQVLSFHVEYPCPWCDRHRWWQWEDVRLDLTTIETAKESICFECPFCHKTFNDLHRIQMGTMQLERARLVARGQHVDEHGVVVGALIKSQTWAITWTALDSPRIALVYLAAKWFEATEQLKQGAHHKMRRFHRDRLCRQYLGDVIEDEGGVPTRITYDTLVRISAASTYGMLDEVKLPGGDSINITDLPSGPAFLIASGDIQRGGEKSPPRIYFEIDGADYFENTWVQAWGHIVFCPAGRQATKAEIFAGLDRWHELIERLSAQYGLPVGKRGFDVGDNQDELRQWLKLHPTYWAIKGDSNTKAQDNNFDQEGWIYRREQHDTNGARWNLYLIDQDAQRVAQDGFLVTAAKITAERQAAKAGSRDAADLDPAAVAVAPPILAGAAHLPRGLDSQRALIRHYCASIEINDGKGTRWSKSAADRKWHPEWTPRKDFLHVRKYLRAMLHAHVTGGGSGQRRTVSAANWFKRK